MIPGPVALFANATVVVPSDTVGNVFSAFMVGVTGAVAFRNSQGATVTLAAVPAYTVIPVATTGINATGTTATNIIGLS